MAIIKQNSSYQMMKYIFRYILLLLFLVHAQIGNSQDNRDSIIQFSGIITQGDSMYAVPGAFVYVPNTTRGTTSTIVGYFNMPVLPGDSVIVAAIGFRKQHLIVPADTFGSYSVVIEMASDTVVLPLVEVSSFPTEEVFKKVFLAMNIDTRDVDNMNQNLNSQILSRIMASKDIDASMSYRFYMDQQVLAIENQYMMNNVSLLDPFAWARFINSIKKEKERKKREKKALENDSGY